MMTAMARIPCKQTLPSQQASVNSFGTRGYWDTQVIQQAQQTQVTQSPQASNTPYVRSNRHQGDYAGKNCHYYCNWTSVVVSG